ncbi:MAG: hypothetical protein WAU00_10335 [Caldilinea sp.]|uniref:hypothetical protein n=1 Tax=Caldilinea sp. TaxID=2293560 RepID=UPI002C27A3D2|nr:hypothetical protein [Anaerolineales bacterium]HQY93094.1 hypothetical protein [Caldilinea sp.]HRA64510.1 hypothetical protein [Caldilinea sp.]
MSDKKFKVAAVAAPGGGSGLCNPSPCIVINGPKTPPPTGSEVATLIKQLAALSDIELDLESLATIAEWLEGEEKMDDALLFAQLGNEHFSQATPREFQQRVLDIEIRCHTHFGNQVEVAHLRNIRDELSILP